MYIFIDKGDYLILKMVKFVLNIDENVDFW
jgi:hypothetical protein